MTGDAVLLRHTVDQIAIGEFQSIGTALITIYLTLSLLLTSFRVGLCALIPNVLPIAIYFGVLGLLDIPLNISTSLIAAITLGIAVDDTVHYFARFALEARRLGDEVKATASTLRSVIRPVTFTTLGLCLGFLVLTLSDLQYQVQFGLLSAFTMAVAWALEITLSPAICSRLRLVTLWDVLRLDLGRDPQHSIPLLAGALGAAGSDLRAHGPRRGGAGRETPVRGGREGARDVRRDRRRARRLDRAGRPPRRVLADAAAATPSARSRSSRRRGPRTST